MKRQLYLTLTLIATSCILLSSCGKDKDPDPAPKTKTELITQGSWKFSKAMSGTTPVSAFIQACIKDNIYTFVAAGTGTMDEGATRCNGADPQTVPFTWNFATSETILHISAVLFPGGSSDFNLVSISETELVLNQTITVGTPQSVTVTLIH